MPRRRVVITGMGAITPLGHSVEELYRHQLAGHSGVDRIRHFHAETFPTQFAAQVRGFDLGQFVPEPARWRYCGVNTQFALAAAKQALDDAGLLEWDGDRLNFGLYLGSGEGHHEFEILTQCLAAATRSPDPGTDSGLFCKQALARMNPDREYEMEMHTTAAHLAREFHLEGPNFTCLTACAASSQAMGEAAEIIRHGDADLMLSGGAHSMIHPLGVTGFNLLTALSVRNDAPQRASRPFDLERDGFVLGEGAGMVILEELDHARRRGATIFAELTGYGSSADAYRITDSLPDGRGAIACIQQALDDAGLDAEAIDYINAHGTSTQVNDKSETAAIKAIFGERAYRIPISSSKSMLGHLIAAAGVVEAITCIQVMRNGAIPPTINYEVPDPECDLDYVPNVAREARVDHALSNSFGFGGQNVSLILSRYSP